ncbi:MAG: hypothetical protein OM95_10580 [Bdellovibrio sp. ArHS]|uniref:hypothetical protein n=1 Tax=Bdellovibrio sp. ArHS TaxID=1569284 RepID=UPI0005835E23|nr:hypothetical protein [Bdellovibrio sp. ArHS]KHD88200.1 MAG: hypothetical protein OM95_10580 [Bdellovibrio sp. ArHS]
MRILLLLFLFIIGLFSSLVVSAEKAFAQSSKNKVRVIDDSLVENLRCTNLTVDNIYKAIRADAFTADRNMPVTNWSFRSGLVPIAGCWALSSTQRMFSYLARYNTVGTQPMSARVPMVLDMVRGQSLVAAEPRETLNAPRYEARKANFAVFAVERNTLSDTNVYNGLWAELGFGYDQYFHGERVRRNFRDDIETNQANRFFRFGNIGMTFKSAERSVKANWETMAQLLKNLNGKRLTLINLRVERTIQHVVMLKSYKKNKNNLYEFTAYDSNQPYKDVTLYFDGTSGQFYSPEIVRGFVYQNASRPVGAFIVSEDERTPLEKALLTHYKGRCR